MGWQETNGRYTLRRGTCEATVWRTQEHGYGAMLSRAGMQLATYGYSTLEDAQAWCLMELARMRQAGECGEAEARP